MQVLVLRHPDDQRLAALLPGIEALGATVKIGGFAAALAGAGGIALLDDGSPEALAAVVGNAGRDELPIVALLSARNPERRSRLLAAGVSRVIEGPETGERVASEIQALVETGGPGHDRLRAELLQPFIASTIESWSLMAGVVVHTSSIFRKTESRMQGDISALIHLVGTSERLLALTMGSQVANALTVAMLNRLVAEPSDEMVCDSVGEMVNIIAGQVKSAFVGTPYEFDIGLPTIITGPNHEVRHRSELPCFVMAFVAPFGPFSLQLCVRNRELNGSQHP